MCSELCSNLTGAEKWLVACWLFNLAVHVPLVYSVEMRIILFLRRQKVSDTLYTASKSVMYPLSVFYEVIGAMRQGTRRIARSAQRAPLVSWQAARLRRTLAASVQPGRGAIDLDRLPNWSGETVCRVRSYEFSKVMSAE